MKIHFQFIGKCPIVVRSIVNESSLYYISPKPKYTNRQQITRLSSFQSLCTKRHEHTLLLMYQYFWWMLFNTGTLLLSSIYYLPSSEEMKDYRRVIYQGNARPYVALIVCERLQPGNVRSCSGQRFFKISLQ